MPTYLVRAFGEEVVTLLFIISVIAVLICALRLCYLAKRVALLERRNFELSRESARRGEFANQVAHEIKNPLTAILCSAQALDLLVGPTLEPIHQRSLRYIKEYGEHLLHLVADFIDLNRSACGAIKARPEAIELRPLIESLSGLLGGVASSRKVHFEIRVEGTIVLNADTRHTKQVLFNLLHNAIKFSEAGGVVQISAVKQAHNAVIEVIDHGSGIAIHDLARIFSAYYTGSNSRDGGLGLGLSVCRALVELNCGTIEARNGEDGGAHFVVRLPLSQSCTASVQTQQSSNPLSGQRFLVVNQDQGVRDSLSHLVTAWGGIVAAAESVEQAVLELARQSFDAVLVDSCDRERIENHLPDQCTTLVATDGEQEKLLRRLIESGACQVQH